MQEILHVRFISERHPDTRPEGHFITMMSSLICLLPPEKLTEPTRSLSQVLAPFAAQVDEYRVYLSREESCALADHYQRHPWKGGGAGDPYLDLDRSLPYGNAFDGISATTVHFKSRGVLSPLFLTSVARHMQDWYGHPGGYDEHHGLFYRTRDNPEGRWSQWEVGGSYDGQLYDGHVAAVLWDEEGPVQDDTEALRSEDMRWVRNVRPACEVTFIPDAMLTPEGIWHERSVCLGTNHAGHSDHDEEEWKEHCRHLLARFPGHHAILVSFAH